MASRRGIWLGLLTGRAIFGLVTARREEHTDDRYPGENDVQDVAAVGVL